MQTAAQRVGNCRRRTIMNGVVTYLEILQWVGLGLVGYVMAVTILNLVTMPRLGRYPQRERYPRVSVLVPARNEEANLPRLIPTLLAQDYPDFEVVVLDDNSTDRTPEILDQFARTDRRIRVISGLPRPRGWLGKNWACHQLSESAKGEWILFTDADTWHRPNSLRSAMDVALRHKLDFLSAILNQEVRTWAERLVVPFYSVYHIFCTLPFALGIRFRRLDLCTANGAFLLFRREAYDHIGGYYSVRSAVLDDQALALRVREQQLRWRFCDGSEVVGCRMYRGWPSVVEGFTKGVFTAFNFAIEPFALAWAGITLIFFAPLLILALVALRQPLNPTLVPIAVASILATLFFWLAVNRRFRFPLYLVPLYPVTIGIALYIGLRSVLMLSTGRATWKGRVIEATGEFGSPSMMKPLPGLKTATFVYWYLGVGVAVLANAYYRMRR